MTDVAAVALGEEARADGTRERLVRAAAEVFSEKGYDRAGVQEIARRAGLTTGAIYSRFSGKAELLLEAIDHSSESEFDSLFADHRFDERATDILTTVGSHLVTRGSSSGEALLLEAIVAARRDPEVAALLREQVDERAGRMAELITAAKADAGIDADLDTFALVRFCHAVGLGFLLFEALNAQMPDPDPWEDLIKRLVHALEPAEGAS